MDRRLIVIGLLCLSVCVRAQAQVDTTGLYGERQDSLGAALNGSSRAYGFLQFPGGRTPVYPMLYAQVTRRFKGIDLYVGAENLTNFRQQAVIVGSPETPAFDASAVWGPLMGFRADAGIRITIWKTY